MNAHAVPAPPSWSAELVLDHLATAMRIVCNTVARGGPKAFGNAMPEVLREFEDLVGLDWEPGQRIEEWMAEIDAQTGRSYSALHLAQADDVLGWPVRFLADHPLQRDAIWLTALSTGVGVDLERILRKRRRIADALVERRKESQPDLIRIYEDDAADAASKIVYWANVAIDKTTSIRKRARIRQAARIRFRREVKAGAIVELHTFVRRRDVVPDKLFNSARVQFHRLLGAQAIADGLQREGKAVR